MLAVLQDPTKVDQLFSSVHRAIIDARRLLKKSAERKHFFCQVMQAYEKGTAESITGPLHAIIKACERISATIECTETATQIKTPLDAVLDLDPPHDTQF